MPGQLPRAVVQVQELPLEQYRSNCWPRVSQTHLPRIVCPFVGAEAIVSSHWYLERHGHQCAVETIQDTASKFEDIADEKDEKDNDPAHSYVEILDMNPFGVDEQMTASNDDERDNNNNNNNNNEEDEVDTKKKRQKLVHGIFTRRETVIPARAFRLLMQA